VEEDKQSGPRLTEFQLENDFTVEWKKTDLRGWPCLKINVFCHAVKSGLKGSQSSQINCLVLGLNATVTCRAVRPQKEDKIWG